MRKIAFETYGNANKVPEKIDFVDANGNLDVINETFDIVFSSHVIEHCPDLIEHLRGVSRILNAGGLYVLIVPDKRYCFDYYHAESTISEVIEAFAGRRKFPRLADVIAHTYTYTHNDAVRHWLGEHGERFKDGGHEADLLEMSRMVDRYSESLAKGEYISTHNWKFTPDNFGYIVNVLNRLKLTDLKLFRLCHTIWGRQEFVTMLAKI